MKIAENTAIIFKAVPDEQNSVDPYQEELLTVGIESHVIPVLTFKFINEELLRQTFAEADKYSALVITSLRTVDAIAKVDRDLLDKWRHPVYAVGEATSKAIEKVMNIIAKGEMSGNAANLVELIAKELQPLKPILFPHGNLARETVMENLRISGFCVHSVTVYETCAHANIEDSLKMVVQEAVPEYFIYFSPSGVTFTLPILKSLSVPLDRIKFVALGPSTEEALLKAELKPFCVAKKPTPNSVVQAIVSSNK